MTSLSEALAPRSDQLNADDLISGPRTLVFTSGRIVKDGRDIKLVLNYQGDNGKPWKPCKTMGRAMVMAWGLTDDNFAERIAGKAVRAYRDPEVKFGDQGAVGGIRISHMSHIDKAVTVKLTVSQGKKSNFVFQPLPGVVEQAEDAQRKWADGFVSSCKNAPDSAQLEQYISKQAKWLKILANERPELHIECDHAINTAREGFKVDQGEGRTDEQHGDQFDGTEAAASNARAIIGQGGEGK